MEFIGGAIACLIIFIGSYYVTKGYSLGKLASFLSALFLVYRPMRSLVETNNTVQEGLAAGTRLFELLDEKPDVTDREGATPLLRVAQSVAFKNVSFRYEQDWVLKDISLAVSVGEVVALVGSSGGGKTTLVNLIPRFYDVTEGQILIDDVDIRNFTVKSLRDQIGIVTQQTILFDDTARNNIAYGSLNKSEDEIIAAAKAGNAHDFIMNLPEGYNTLIGEQGVKLSGGERQRIAIARALLKDAPILILDEATSSLDSESEQEVQRALEKLMVHRTVFVIAHRLSTIRKADRILVIKDGGIVEEGDHKTLMGLGGEYRRLYRIQFRDVEPSRTASAEGIA
jgi:subfamily B ATP-binding cassette protein MsbA